VFSTNGKNGKGNMESCAIFFYKNGLKGKETFSKTIVQDQESIQTRQNSHYNNEPISQNPKYAGQTYYAVNTPYYFQ